jgi:hypothetical protein
LTNISHTILTKVEENGNPMYLCSGCNNVLNVEGLQTSRDLFSHLKGDFESKANQYDSDDIEVFLLKELN